MPARPTGWIARFLLAAVTAVGCSGSAPRSPVPGAGSTPPGPSASSPASSVDPRGLGVRLEAVTGGLERPLLVTGAGDGSGRLFVVEQAGVIRIVRGRAVEPEAFLDLSERVSSGGERGLLGLAFHPRFPQDPRLFVNYTDLAGDTVVAEYRVDPVDPDRGDPATARTLLTVEQPYPNHNGGATVFGPDGYLYVGLGDGGGGGDPEEVSQDLGSLLGKILRLDVDATAGSDRPYAIPPGNPFAGRDGAMAEIWHLGLRNPWRLSFDRSTGDMWIGDVGQSAFEEIDVAPAGQGGLNFGWDVMEGEVCYEPGDGCDPTGLTLPVAVYPNEGDRCVVVGGYVYRGSASPALAGGYVFGDYCSGEVFLLDPREPDLEVALDADRLLSSFGEDDGGELFATDLAAGELLRVVAQPA